MVAKERRVEDDLLDDADGGQQQERPQKRQALGPRRDQQQPAEDRP